MWCTRDIFKTEGVPGNKWALWGGGKLVRLQQSKNSHAALDTIIHVHTQLELWRQCQFGETVVVQLVSCQATATSRVMLAQSVHASCLFVLFSLVSLLLLNHPKLIEALVQWHDSLNFPSWDSCTHSSLLGTKSGFQCCLKYCPLHATKTVWLVLAAIVPKCCYLKNHHLANHCRPMRTSSVLWVSRTSSALTCIMRMCSNASCKNVACTTRHAFRDLKVLCICVFERDREISHFFFSNEVIDDLLCVREFMCVGDDVRAWIEAELVWSGQRQRGVIKHTHTHTPYFWMLCSHAPSSTGNSFPRGHNHRGDSLRGGGPTKVKGDKGHVTAREIQSRMRRARQTKQKRKHELIWLNWIWLNRRLLVWGNLSSQESTWGWGTLPYSKKVTTSGQVQRHD